jgi:hypothetical protein
MPIIIHSQLLILSPYSYLRVWVCPTQFCISTSTYLGWYVRKSYKYIYKKSYSFSEYILSWWCLRINTYECSFVVPSLYNESRKHNHQIFQFSINALATKLSPHDLLLSFLFSYIKYMIQRRHNLSPFWRTQNASSWPTWNTMYQGNI